MVQLVLEVQLTPELLVILAVLVVLLDLLDREVLGDLLRNYLILVVPEVLAVLLALVQIVLVFDCA
jgi:hypothetical protein